MSSLTIKNIDLTIGGNDILKDISTHFNSGELVGLIGPNGAGKSSLIKAILGLADDATGSISLDGEDFSAMPIKDRAKRISYAAQGAPVHWPLTVENIVALGRLPHMNPWRQMSTQDQQVVNDVLDQTDTEHLKGRSVMTLSGGERARVLLARALATKADYLMADEPTASLDPAHQLQIMDILKKQSQHGKGICVVLHDLSLAQRYCDRLILLHEGCLVADNSPDTVLSDDTLKDVFGIKVSRWREGEQSYLIPSAL